MSNQERTVLFQLPTVISGQLVCTQGTLAGRSWTLSAGTFVIGRAPGSDLLLSAEPGVSKLHAKIVAEGDHYALIDNESRNGTIVNGRPVQRVRLKTGDQIRICNCVLRFTQTGEGIPLSAEGPPVVEERPPALDLPPPTPPGPRDPGPAAPAPAAPAPSASLPPAQGPGSSGTAGAPDPSVSVELPRPAPEVRVASAMPWFVGGLVLVLVVGGAGWLGVRVFDDALFGPVSATVAAADAKDPIARERAAEEAMARGGDDEAEKLAQADERGAVAEDEPAAADEGAPSAADEPAEAADEEAAEEEGEERGQESPPQVAAADPTPPTASARPAVSATKAPSAESAPRAWYPVVVEREGPLSVRTRASGTVASVSASDGQSVRRGELLFAFESTDSDEISNLRANIEALEAVAESQPSAQDMLEREREKLKRLLARSGNVNVTAPAAGTLRSFSVKVGDVLKSGESVGVIERGGVTLLVNVPAAEGRSIKKGAVVELKTTSGSASGRVASVKRRGADYQVVLSTDASPSDVNEARF